MSRPYKLLSQLCRQSRVRFDRCSGSYWSGNDQQLTTLAANTGVVLHPRRRRQQGRWTSLPRRRRSSPSWSSHTLMGERIHRAGSIVASNSSKCRTPRLGSLDATYASALVSKETPLARSLASVKMANQWRSTPTIFRRLSAAPLRFAKTRKSICTLQALTSGYESTSKMCTRSTWMWP
nr:hypothetical protein Iba_chr10bCG8690 [Ipomoea batatas]